MGEKWPKVFYNKLYKKEGVFLAALKIFRKNKWVTPSLSYTLKYGTLSCLNALQNFNDFLILVKYYDKLLPVNTLAQIISIIRCEIIYSLRNQSTIIMLNLIISITYIKTYVHKAYKIVRHSFHSEYWFSQWIVP